MRLAIMEPESLARHLATFGSGSKPGCKVGATSLGMAMHLNVCTSALANVVVGQQTNCLRIWRAVAAAWAVP
jgi:hypothetical protein